MQLVEDYVRRTESDLVPDDGIAANELLDSLHQDGRVPDLLPIFESTSMECHRTLAFLLSEIGPRSIEAMDWLNELIQSEDSYVAYYSIRAVQHSGSLIHGRTTARAVASVERPHPTNWSALMFLAMGSLRQVATCIPFLAPRLASSVHSLVAGRMVVGAFEADLALSLIGIAAAYRHRSETEVGWPNLTHHADSDIAAAASWIDQFRPLPVESRDILHRLDRDPPD